MISLNKTETVGCGEQKDLISPCKLPCFQGSKLWRVSDAIPYQVNAFQDWKNVTKSKSVRDNTPYKLEMLGKH